MAETPQAERREGMLRKVRALLAQAAGTPFTEEADAFRQKADELMAMFAINEFELQDPGQKKEAIVKREMYLCEYGHPLMQQICDLASAIAFYCRVKLVYYGLRNGKKTSRVSIAIVGFESDQAYFDMLFTGLQMHMAKDLEPKWRDSETQGQNVRRMKEAGMKWERIAFLCNIPFPGPQAITIYKRQCKEDGVQPMKTMPSVYVRNFAAGFVTEIQQRLVEIRNTTMQNVQDGGHSLVLFKDKDAQVKDAYYEMFPKLGTAPVKASGKFDGAARAAGAKSGATADLSKGKVGGANKGLNA